MNAVRCTHCGGAVAVRPGRSEPRCLFCGSAALVPHDPHVVDPPEGFVAFTVDAAAADEAFRTFARSSFWYPAALRHARLELRRLLLPAWAWRGRVETHWAGLVTASTRSGKRPVTGREEARFDQVLVPASASLSQAELTALGGYDEAALAPWSPEAVDEPHEVSELSREAARSRAAREMARRHAARIEGQRSLRKIRSSSVPHDLVGRPVLVPVWIGVYTWKDRPRRVLVHGCTGHVVGDAPLDALKIALAVLGGMIAVAALVLLVVALA